MAPGMPLAMSAAWAAMQDDAVLVDVRTDPQRARDGEVPGAIRYALNHLEWRVDQTAETPDPRFAGVQRIVVLCDEGYSSSLAAARLQALGVAGATDVIGGFQRWRADGLPVAHTPAAPGVGPS